MNQKNEYFKWEFFDILWRNSFDKMTIYMKTFQFAIWDFVTKNDILNMSHFKTNNIINIKKTYKKLITKIVNVDVQQQKIEKKSRIS